MSRFLDRATINMNQGTRAYAFGLGLLPWLLQPLLLIVSTVIVIAVQYRRDFRSLSLKVLNRWGVSHRHPRFRGNDGILS